MVEIIRTFIWEEWHRTKKSDLEKILNMKTKEQIIEIVQGRITELNGTKAQIIKKITDAIFLNTKNSNSREN